LPKDSSEEIRNWLYTGGWSNVVVLLKNVLARKATADEETILISLERLHDAEWKDIPDMCMYLLYFHFIFHFVSFRFIVYLCKLRLTAPIIGNKTRTPPVKRDVTAEVQGSITSSNLWDLDKLLYDFATLRVTSDHDVIKQGVKKAGELKYSHYVPDLGKYIIA
jgi:hypothetical protein